MASLAVSPTSGIYWNLSEDVGTGKPNLVEDVELVRFGYHCWLKTGTHSRPLSAPLELAIRVMLPWGGFGPDLDLVIREHQKWRGGQQDGCISKVKMTSGNQGYVDGTRLWIMIVLSNSMLLVHPHIFPRIDLAAESGAEVSGAVVRICNREA
jgi:hypothetical protein